MGILPGRISEEGIAVAAFTQPERLSAKLPVAGSVSLDPFLPPGPRRPQGSSAVSPSGKFSGVGLLLRIRTGPGPGAAAKRLVLSEGRMEGERLPRAPLLLVGLLLGSFVPGAFCGSPTHSLCYFYLKLPEPSQGLPQFLIRGYLDDQPITRFDSLTGKMKPLVPWMEEKEKEAFLAPEWVFRSDLEKLSKLGHHAGGLHTWQAVLGCELTEDGSKGGFLHYGYDGRDFISFDKETLRWVASQPQAQKVKEKWEEDPRWSQENKVFLEETCIDWLQRYLSYQKETPQRTEPPVGKVTRKVVDDSLEVLICQAFGFYPKDIRATWTRDGEDWGHETLRRDVAPNSDGTYYVQLSIDIDPKEKKRFRCHLEHEGLQEPLVLAWKEEPGWQIHVLFVVGVILDAGLLFLICWWRTMRKFHLNVTTHLHQVSRKKPPSPPMDGTEDKTPSQLMLQLQVISEHNTTG